MGKPLLLASNCFRIISPFNPDSKSITEANARFEQVRRLFVNFRTSKVPEYVAAFLVKEDDAIGENINSFAKAFFSPVRCLLGPPDRVVIARVTWIGRIQRDGFACHCRLTP